MKKKIIRTSTIAASLNGLLKGQLSFLNNHYEILAVSGADEHLNALKEREGVEIRNIPMQRAISPLKDLVSLFKLYMLFRKEKPTIVHSITPKAGLLSMVAARLARVPIRIHTFTGLIFPSKKGTLQRVLIIMDKVLCGCATHVFPEGLGVERDLTQYRITKKPLKIIANGNVNGIDLKRFSPHHFDDNFRIELKTKLNIIASDFVFIFVGRLVSDKGVNELLNAFSKLSSKHLHIKLLLVGPFEEHLDPLLPTTLQLIKENKNVISIGYVKDVRPYLAIADCLVLPSYREGFPNVVLQAGAMELPSIVTDINGSNEIIEQDLNGIIVPVRDSDALQASMDTMIEDTEYRIRLKNYTREKIVKYYQQEVVWDALLTEYQKIENNV